jgi:DNA polymerase elongation subunit (family B)
MDYMELYKKYNYEERTSYALNSIAEYELGETKIQYDCTLDDLYNDDFQKFLEYNIQDTRLLDRLDKKLQFIDLANSVAHANCVPIPATMGTVAVVDQAVLMDAHTKGMIAPNRKHDEGEDVRAAGGWVATPKKGLHQWIASTDMKSLYPSVIRTLNMSPETIVGQIRLDRTNAAIAEYESKGSKYTFAKWWNDRFNVLEMDDFYNKDIGTKLILDMEDGSELEITGSELHDIIFESGQPWCISANGTIFRTDKDGIIPGILTRWYGERKVLQKKATQVNEVVYGLDLADYEPIENTSTEEITFKDLLSFNRADLDQMISTQNVDMMRDYINTWGLEIIDKKLYPTKQYKKLWSDLFQYYDKQQLVKKILLNSAYGALLNSGSRFFDQRLGQSTTLTGRTITKHMTAKSNEMITGEYDHYGASTVYGDTDSCFFSAYPVLKDQIDRGEIEWTKETIIDMYNGLAKAVSDTFPEFLKNKLNVPINRSTGVIASSRETISISGLWIVKKRYACLMFDKDGIRLDINGKAGKIKAMGLDLRRSDTPKFVQEFLSEILLDTLTNKGENAVIEKIKLFKQKFEDKKPWDQGTPKAVNKLSHYRDKLEDAMHKKMKGIAVGNLHVPGHVTASLAWNRLKEIHRDQHTMSIIDGQKVVVCKLRETSENILTSIARPIDENHLPNWFTELPFDSEDMMAGIVDKKILNLLSPLNWDLARATKDRAHMETLFDFSAM